MVLTDTPNPVLTIQWFYDILILLACILIKIVVGFYTPLHIEIQPIIVKSLNLSPSLIPRREFLSPVLYERRQK